MKTVFLDRDGVINVRLVDDWAKTWDEFEFVEGSVEAVQMLKDAGYKLILITNQRAVSLGLLTMDGLREIHDKMQESFGFKLDDIYICPHGRECTVCRKPAPGMLLDAAKDHELDLSETVFFGDSDTDKVAADAAGVGTFIKVSIEKTLLDCVKEFLG